MGDGARVFAALVILLAMVLIAVGRLHIRRARGITASVWRRRRKKTLGWGFVLLGLLCMIAGVVLW